jgi:hypothetical protein
LLTPDTLAALLVEYGILAPVTVYYLTGVT